MKKKNNKSWVVAKIKRNARMKTNEDEINYESNKVELSFKSLGIRRRKERT